MRSLNEEVWRLIWGWPILFCDTTYQKSRRKALNQLYLVLGNGYEWVDGRLVEKWPSKPHPGEAQNFDEFHPYPLTQGAAITELPDDIQPDWLQGAREIWKVACYRVDGNELAQRVSARIAYLLREQAR